MRPVLVGLAATVIILVGVLLRVGGGAGTQTVAAPSTISTQEAVTTTDALADAIAAAEAEYNALGTPQEQRFFQAYEHIRLHGDSDSEVGRQELAYQYLDRHRAAQKAVAHLTALRTAFKASHPKWKASHPEFEQEENEARMDRLQEQVSKLQCEQDRANGLPTVLCR